jgi:hypothetical protein
MKRNVAVFALWAFVMAPTAAYANDPTGSPFVHNPWNWHLCPMNVGPFTMMPCWAKGLYR